MRVGVRVELVCARVALLWVRVALPWVGIALLCVLDCVAMCAGLRYCGWGIALLCVRC